ncbi:hypothetical protein T265_05007 [Opisthorchis viverrini]|uniref:Uncharacterized protein n=1 Tax=Opisthorchis viverrini TaxID=6198 RepID=A0A074ZM12_OPIVI|nr:hypothetical protein T265_05007 [Opisthorchis viverrini]KER28096.1 hypothetical protein T265_05007 [Opisthorchis viverrini]
MHGIQTSRVPKKLSPAPLTSSQTIWIENDKTIDVIRTFSDRTTISNDDLCCPTTLCAEKANPHSAWRTPDFLLEILSYKVTISEEYPLSKLNLWPKSMTSEHWHNGYEIESNEQRVKCTFMVYGRKLSGDCSGVEQQEQCQKRGLSWAWVSACIRKTVVHTAYLTTELNSDARMKQRKAKNSHYSKVPAEDAAN